MAAVAGETHGYPDAHESKREPARLIGVEDRLFVGVEGHAGVYAIAEEDLPRETVDETADETSALRVVRFESTLAQRQVVGAGAAVKSSCDHTHYPVHVSVAAEALASLAGDLR